MWLFHDLFKMLKYAQYEYIRHDIKKQKSTRLFFVGFIANPRAIINNGFWLVKWVFCLVTCPTTPQTPPPITPQLYNLLR